MAIALRFNGEQFYTDLRERLVEAMNKSVTRFFNEATFRMSAEAKADSDLELAKIEGITDYFDPHNKGSAAEEYINARCKFYADAIVESFGIGSKADMGMSSYWDDYEKSEFFNEARRAKRTNAILGRKKGPYKDLWGRPAESSGKKEGQLLESKTGRPRKWKDEKTGKWIKLEPKYGNFKIQQAEAWVIKNGETYVERAIETAVEKFLIEMQQNSSKYFYYVEV